jgi:mannose-1-phosphate guanylyltransferase/mannose-6-phosphate isomerase
MSLQPVILSGGSGTRLWPLSREAYPKQFLPLTSEHTMLQETVRRLDGIDAEHPRQAIGLLDPIVVCNEAHRFLVAEQLRLLGRQSAAIILEPKGRNTAPALELAALAATRDGGDPVLLVMPADHTIRNEPGFRRAAADGYALAQEGAVVTFGIVPDKPETGYGYIRQGGVFDTPGLGGEAYVLRAFVEKPDAPTADEYLRSGEYLWNSGIFMMRASVWQRLLARFRPDIAAASDKSFAGGSRDGDFLRLDADAFHSCPSDSIDYAVMERLSGDSAEEGTPALVLPLAVGWSDVGAWSALWEVSERDEAGNVLEGDAFVHNARDNLLVAHHRMVAVVGVDNLIVVETPDAVLVADKGSSQDVKAVTQFLQREQRSEHRHHQRMHRPWGDFESIDNGERYQVKRLTVKPGESLSLQMHHHRAEHWIVVSGTAQVTNGDDTFLLTENQSTYIPVGATHRLENPGSLPLEIIEVQSGSYLGEDDIVRFEDIYNRAEGET